MMNAEQMFKELGYEKECIIEHIKSNCDIDGFELEKIVLKG